jgi:hypothetical protein
MAMDNKLLRPKATAAAAPPAPTTIPGLQYWIDINDLSMLGNTSSGSGGAANNGPVKFVGDKSGNARNFVNTGADSVAPTLLQSRVNGRAALSFDGGDHLLSLFSLSLTSQTTNAVLRYTHVRSFARIIVQQANNTNDFGTANIHTPIARNATSQELCSVTNLSGFSRASVSGTYDTWIIFCNVHTGSEIQNSVNNGTRATAVHTLSNTIDRTILGAYQAVNAFQDNSTSEIATVMMWNRDLSSGEQEQMIRALGTQYGITVA